MEINIKMVKLALLTLGQLNFCCKKLTSVWKKLFFKHTTTNWRPVK